MKKLMLTMMVAVMTALTATAVPITIADGSVNSGNSWWNTANENQEVEPFCLTGQVWDMESFDLTGNTLTMTGGFNFTTPSGYGGFKPGDLFFDVNGGGYDYVATISGAGSTYSVYSLGNTYGVYYAQNATSNPWKYKDGGTLIASGLSVTYGSFGDVEGTHYTANLNLSWLDSLTSAGDVITLHNTMECGNDNLMGRYTVAVSDTGNTMAMCGLGLIGLVGFKRKMS